jgi:hypothetical protein
MTAKEKNIRKSPAFRILFNYSVDMKASHSSINKLEIPLFPKNTCLCIRLLVEKWLSLRRS